MAPTTTSLEQEIEDLREQIELLKLTCDRLARQSPPGSIWFLAESQYCQNFPCVAPEGSHQIIAINEWHCFPASWREHLLGLKAANDRNADYAQYRIEIWPQ